MNKDLKLLIQKKAAEFLKADIQEIRPLPPAGSNRQYFRIHASGTSIVAAYNPIQRENEAFLHLSKVFHSIGLPVPVVLHYMQDYGIYFLTDLGDQVLFDRIQKEKPHLEQESLRLLKEAIRTLCTFQVEAADRIDFSKCYPREAFDRRSIQWDFNYFKYNFLNLGYIHYDEEKLEEDFTRLHNKIAQVPADFFMYRDFQSRNIMIHNNHPYFIDYQGGRRGPLGYDVASLLFQVRADFSWELRDELLNTYLQELEHKKPQMVSSFTNSFSLFIYLRLMQVLGAYGFRGIYQKKPHFLASISYAAKLLAELPQHYPLPMELPEISKIFASISKKYTFEYAAEENKLKVSIYSFSYKKGGIPVDFSGNGGGHVFDCRALPNPGRLEEMRSFNGMDQIIIDYLEEKPEVQHFLENVYKIIAQSVSNYRERNFKNLMVSFGCTGGQHRSVYCAQKLKQYLEKDTGIVIEVNHQEQKKE